MPHNVALAAAAKAILIPIKETRSTCPYCGVGCGVVIESRGDQVIGVRGDERHPANFGQLCSKGSTLHLTMRPTVQAQRVKEPMIRVDKQSPRHPTTWDSTLDHLAERFAETIITHGPDSVGFYLSGQLLTEDYYVFNKIAKGLIGTNNVDTNSRLCMSSAVAGYKLTLGADAPPCSYEDIDYADCVFIAGSNMAYAHPILYRRLEAARLKRPDMKVIVVDPRKTDTAREASLHLAIQPGTDVALFNGMLHLMLWDNLVNNDYIASFTDGFDALKATVRDYTPQMVATTCGIREVDLVEATRLFAQSPATLSLYCQGLNQSTSGTHKNAALINLHLATGHIGRAGAGPFSLTGQPNAMGGREVGGLANLLSAHRDMSNPEHRGEVAKLWGVSSVPSVPGKTAVDMFTAAAEGKIKALWIACTNPAQSLPNQNAVHQALANTPLVVVQEAYANTETVPYADVLLPASAWAEKEGTVTNSERRITRVNGAVAAPGDAKHDWQIAAEFARRLEIALAARGYTHGKRTDGAVEKTLFPYTSAEEIWNEHRETTRGRDCDITGLSYATLARAPQQWPFTATHQLASAGEARLYADRKFPTDNGRAQFANVKYLPVAEPVDARYPFRLNTGRLRDQWHAMSRTGTVGQLYGHAPEPVLQLNMADMGRRGLKEGDLVTVESRRGQVTVLLAPSEEINVGQAYLPMHWGQRFLGGKQADGSASHGVNTLTQPAYCPTSKQPELKHAAVRIMKAELPWRFTAIGVVNAVSEAAGAVALIDALQPFLHTMPFASAVMVGRHDQRSGEGVLLRLASAAPPDAAWLAKLDALFDLDSPNTIRYDDIRKHVGRRILVRDGRLAAVRLSGELLSLAAEPWLKDWLTRGESVEPIRKLLLLPTATPPSGFAARGKTVCSCWNVTSDAIDAFLDGASGDAAAMLSTLQAQLKCGTNCGSCVPELKQIVAAKVGRV